MLLLLLACATSLPEPKGDTGSPVVVHEGDADGDGYALDADCNDEDGTVHPGAPEACNGWDDDCDGLVDEAGATGTSTWYADADGDGYGDPAAPIDACTAPASASTNAQDCDDTRADVSPAGVEVCGGGDEDCDGLVDDADTVTGGSTWYPDGDRDGAGATSGAITACVAPAGYVASATDCDDTRADVSPTAREVCDPDRTDEDCDGAADDDDPDVDPASASAWYTDGDADGYGAGAATQACHASPGTVVSSTDCDDTRATVSPAATETCDGLDDDCDGLVDDADPSVSDSTRTMAWPDADGDGHGTPTGAVVTCGGPGWAADGDDCDDADATVHPGALEDCATAADDDCDGATDEEDALGCVASHLDTDGDGWGTASVCTCTATLAVEGDCDDADATIHPGADEVCDRADQDCDGLVDEDLPLFAVDADGDGYGAIDAPLDCAPGGVADRTDCDDTTTAVSPAVNEQCDGIDDDCDGLVDDADPDVLGDTFYADTDADGYGDASATVSACVAPPGYVADPEDCDDTQATVHPGATEVYGNGLDDDCDGVVRPEACDEIYDQSTLQTFDLEFSDADWFGMSRDCRAGRQSYRPVILTWNGDSVSAKARLKGNWSWNCSKFQFIVSFDEDDPDARWHGLRKLVFDAPWYDWTLMHERLAFPLFERLDLPYSCANNTRVNVNGSYYGLYANVERLDHEYLERNFEDAGGNLYQGGSELKTNEDAPDTSDLTALHAATTVEQIEAVVDLDEATSEWAAEAMIPAMDNYWAGVEINYYLYHYPDGKFLYLPYDLDLTFGDGAYGDGTLVWPEALTADPITWEHSGWRKETLFETVLADPDWCEIFVDKLTAARAEYDPITMAASVYEWDDQIYTAYEEDPHKIVSLDSHEAAVEMLVQFLQDRADFVDAWLAEGGHCPATW